MLGAFSYTNRDPDNIRNNAGHRRRRALRHRLLSRQYVAVHLRRRTVACDRRHPARPGDGHRPAHVGAARLRHRPCGGHLQHADGVLSAAPDLRDHGPHRVADSVQRPARQAVTHHCRHRSRPLWQRRHEHRSRHLQPIHDPGRAFLAGNPRRQRHTVASRGRREEHGVHRCDLPVSGQRPLGVPQ